MKRKEKNYEGKFIVFMLIVAICSLLIRPAAVEAAGTYDRDAALRYAAAHWDDGKGKCAEFASDVLKAGGITGAWSTGCTTLRSQLLKLGVGTEYEIPLVSQSVKMSNYRDKISAGDLFFYYCPGCVNIDGKPYIHVVVVAGEDSSGYMRAYSHNNKNSGSSRYYYSSKCYDCATPITKGYVFHFNGSGGNGGSGNSSGTVDSSPKGCVDNCSGGAGEISFGGWSMQRGYNTTEVHVYIGGPAGSANAEGHSGVICNLYRPDVREVYGCSDYTGFNNTIKTDKRGNQTVYFYAINQCGEYNPLIGTKNVYISDPLSMSFNKSSLTVNAGEKSSFDISFKGSGIYQLAYSGGDGVASCQWGNVDWTNGKATLYVTGTNAGTTDITIHMQDSNKKDMMTKKIAVSVKANATLSLNTGSISFNEGESKSVYAAYGGSGISYIDTKWINGDDIATVEWGSQENNQQEIKLKAKKAGSSTLKIMLLDQNKNEVISRQLSVTVKHVHVFVTENAKAATCTENGKTRRVYCSVCGYEKEQAQVIPKTGHNLIEDPAVPATCTTDGCSKGAHCSRCSYRVVQTKVPAYGHAFDEGKVSTMPTCDHEGVKVYTCSRCKMTRYEVIPKLESGNDDTQNGQGNTQNGQSGQDDTQNHDQTDLDDTQSEKQTDGNDMTRSDRTKDEHSGDTYDETNETDDPVHKDGVDFSDAEYATFDGLSGAEYDTRFDGEESGTFIVSGLEYRITDESKVMVSALVKKNRKNVEIPGSVAYQDKKYKVVGISDKAFMKAKKMTSVSIPNGVESIGSKTFYGCKKLKEVKIGSGLRSIGRSAFGNCSKLKTVTIKSKNLQSVSKNAFKGVNAKCKFTVPSSVRRQYQDLIKEAGFNKV